MGFVQDHKQYFYIILYDCSISIYSNRVLCSKDVVLVVSYGRALLWKITVACLLSTPMQFTFLSNYTPFLCIEILSKNTSKSPTEIVPSSKCVGSCKMYHRNASGLALRRHCTLSELQHPGTLEGLHGETDQTKWWWSLMFYGGEKVKLVKRRVMHGHSFTCMYLKEIETDVNYCFI